MSSSTKGEEMFKINIFHLFCLSYRLVFIYFVPSTSCRKTAGDFELISKIKIVRYVSENI